MLTVTIICWMEVTRNSKFSIVKFRITSGAKVNCEKKTCKLELGVGRSPYMSNMFLIYGEMYHDLLAVLHAHFRVLDIFLKEAFPSCQVWPGASHACAPISSWDAAVDEGQMSLLPTNQLVKNDLEIKSLNLSPGPMPTWRFSHSSEDIAV